MAFKFHEDQMPATTPHYLPPHAYLALTRALARALPDIARPDLEAAASEILADAGIGMSACSVSRLAPTKSAGRTC